MSGRAGPAPADLRTLVSWRRTGLVLGITALGVLAAGFLVALFDSSPGLGRAAVLVLGGATLLALGASAYLRRVWSEPLHRDGPWSARGRRVSAIVGATWGLGVLLNALRAGGVQVPEFLGLAAAGAFGASVVGMVGVALRDRPGRS